MGVIFGDPTRDGRRLETFGWSLVSGGFFCKVFNVVNGNGGGGRREKGANK